MKYKAEVLRANVPSKVGRIYTKECLESAYNYIHEKINDEDLLVGELDNELEDEFESYNIINPIRISHKIVDSTIEDNKLFVYLKILDDTPSGKIVEDMLNNGVKLYANPRAIGNVDKNWVVYDYELTTIDLYNEPVYEDSEPLVLYDNGETDNND